METYCWPGICWCNRCIRSALVLFLLLTSSQVIASMSGSPNPSNNGDYTVSWTPVSGAQSHQLYESTNGGATWGFPMSLPGSVNSKSFTGKAPGSYLYKLYSCWQWIPPGQMFAETDCGYVNGTTTVTVRPPVPTGLDGPSIDYNGDFTVSWNTASGFTSKLRERLNSGTWSTVHSGSAESDFRPDRTPGTWRSGVRACLGSNCSLWSSSIAVSVPSPPSAPTGLDGPTTDYNGAFTMSWNTSSGATSYRLYEIRPDSSTYTYTVSSTSKGITDKLDAPGSYSYRVRGCMPESTCGAWSGYVNVDVQGPPNTPGGLNGPEQAVPEGESYTISWGTSSGTYQLEEQPEGGDWQLVPAGSEPLSRILSNDPGAYWYQVRACHPENVCSGWSSPISVTVFETTASYGYDARGRLQQVNHPNGVVTDYGYDAAGNVISKSSLEN